MLSGFNSIPYCCFHWLGLLEISNSVNTGDTTMPICGREVTILIYLSFSHLRAKKLTPGFFGFKEWERNEGFEVRQYNHFSSYSWKRHLSPRDRGIITQVIICTSSDEFRNDRSYPINLTISNTTRDWSDFSLFSLPACRRKSDFALLPLSVIDRGPLNKRDRDFFKVIKEVFYCNSDKR